MRSIVCFLAAFFGSVNASQTNIIFSIGMGGAHTKTKTSSTSDANLRSPLETFWFSDGGAVLHADNAFGERIWYNLGQLGKNRCPMYALGMASAALHYQISNNHSVAFGLDVALGREKTTLPLTGAYSSRLIVRNGPPDYTTYPKAQELFIKRAFTGCFFAQINGTLSEKLSLGFQLGYSLSPAHLSGWQDSVYKMQPHLEPQRISKYRLLHGISLGAVLDYKIQNHLAVSLLCRFNLFSTSAFKIANWQIQPGRIVTALDGNFNWIVPLTDGSVVPVQYDGSASVKTRCRTFLFALSLKYTIPLVSRQ